MPDDVFYLTKDERDYLEETLKKVNRFLQPTRGRPQEDFSDEGPSPEVYLVKPEMEDTAVEPADGDKPSSTMCVVYKMNRETAEDDWEMIKVQLPDGSDKIIEVLNPWDVTLPFGLLTAKRTKYGRWIFESTGNSSVHVVFEAPPDGIPSGSSSSFCRPISFSDGRDVGFAPGNSITVHNWTSAPVGETGNNRAKASTWGEDYSVDAEDRDCSEEE